MVTHLTAHQSGAAEAEPATQPVSFRRDVAPILMAKCVNCHGPEKAKAKFKLDSFDHLRQPGESKAAPLTPGKPEQSELYRLITADDEDDRMPKKADPLPEPQVRLVRRWIEQGAKFDGPDPAAPIASLVADQEHSAPPEVYRQPIPITAIAFSPDGNELAVSGYHEITLWNPTDGKPLGRIRKLPERTHGLAYSPDGQWLAAAGGTPGALGEVRLCEARSQSPGKVLDRVSDVMLAVRFSPDGARLAAGGSDNAIRIYNVQSVKRELLIEPHADWVMDLAFSPDGARLVSASRDKSARVFDAKTGAMHAAYLGHEEPVLSVAWSSDGKSIFSAGRDRKIKVWNAADAKEIGEIAGLDAQPFKLQTAMGFVFCCFADGSLRQYSQEKRDLVRSFPQAAEWIYCIAIDEKHKRLAAGSYSGEVRVMSIDDGAVITTFIAAPGYVNSLKKP